MKNTVKEGRILILENNLEFGNALAELLQDEGYQTVITLGIKEARRHLEDDHFHLLISDIRLEDDDNELDQKGIEFIQQEHLKVIPKIVVTSFPTFENAQKAMGHAVHIEPKDNPMRILQTVNQTFKDEVKVNWSLQIQFNEYRPLSLLYLAELLMGGRGEQVLKDALELKSLLRGLFPGVEALRIDRLLWHRRGRIALVVYLFEAEKMPTTRVVICSRQYYFQQEEQSLKENAPNVADIKVYTDTSMEDYQTVRLGARAFGLLGGKLTKLGRPWAISTKMGISRIPFNS